jgi:glycosyltransferase involved in cell wall biosynthesis
VKEYDVDGFREGALPSEPEIMSRWMGRVPLVSVVCTAYNHKDYIEDAIRGFLIQRTEFPFEIIIHDDASTDGTDLILKRYADKYPSIIKLIIQTENQYSKGRRVIPLAAKWSSGEYLALCEGDDFWVNPEKLSMQLSAMRANPQCRISFHRTLVWKSGISGGMPVPSIWDRLMYPSRNFVFSSSSVILGDGHFMPTPSIMVKKVCLDELPEWFDETPVGDYFIQVLASIPGGALYLADAMCVYRVHSNGSWSVQMRNDPTRRLRFFDSYLSSMNKLAEVVAGEYRNHIEKMIFIRFCHLLLDRQVSLEEIKSRVKVMANVSGRDWRMLQVLLSSGVGARAGGVIRVVAFRAFRSLFLNLSFLSRSGC